ncbi:hypothetical protein JG688_00012503 [Phytophthora aleatoria]|uniref:HTH myb-type domain-containing protein n=1 Tax=Phytophthora aleatoria TaxID=2496075 RepID=A0A8J5J2M4_9STRA|nr:hypothetical protein JG688_00012503 [Phytophthora aleatoria]
MISPEVMQELLAVRQVLHYLPESQSTEKGWTPHEQQLFWAAVTKYPQGPWSAIAKYIGTKTTRQAMTHAQKLRQKLKRWNARLRRNPAVGSLMDGVVVTADGNVAVSASANSTLNASYNIPPAASLIPVAPPSAVQLGSCRVSDDVPTELESKYHEQHGIHSTTVSYMAVPVQLRIVDRCRPSQIPATEHASSEDHALPTSIPHELVDELAKSLLEEDNVDDDDTKRTQGDRH